MSEPATVSLFFGHLFVLFISLLFNVYIYIYISLWSWSSKRDAQTHLACHFGDPPEASCSPVVCQGSEPFGPFMEITAVQQQHAAGLRGGGSGGGVGQVQSFQRNPQRVFQRVPLNKKCGSSFARQAGETAGPSANLAFLWSFHLGENPPCALRFDLGQEMAQVHAFRSSQLVNRTP